MFKFGSALLAFGVVTVLLVSQSEAQQKRTSPRDQIYARVGGKLVSVSYGRPFSKDPKKGEVRKIWGGLVPWGKAWRTGSDEQTTLVTEAPIKVGDAEVPAGAYTLYTVPMENGPSKLAISMSIGKWGIPVDEKNDLARVDMTKKSVDKDVDQFTMAFAAEKGAPSATLTMTWEKTQFSVPISAVKK
jgi:hypothetical protein